MNLIPDLPQSQGAANAIRRSRQLSTLRWTPVRPFPAVLKSAGTDAGYLNFFFPAYRPLTGAAYSSVRLHEKYVGYNVLPETYLSAMANPNSCLYTKSMHDRGVRNCAPFYGTVCSEFVSYSLALPYRTACKRWPAMDGISEVSTEPLENLRLCDIVLNVRQHIMLITGIWRDEAGKIASIEISESKLPTVCVTKFTPDEFTNAFLRKEYRVYRYAKLDSVPYTPDPCVHLDGDPDLPFPEINRVLLPDYGNKANYLPSEPVELTVFDPAYTEVVIRKDGAELRILPVENGMAVLRDAPVGQYEAAARSADGESEPVLFCVTGASVRTEKAVYAAGEPITVYPSCETDDPAVCCMLKQLGAPFGDRGLYVFPDGKADAATFPGLVPGEYAAVSYYRNGFGVYTSPRVPFTVAE